MSPVRKSATQTQPAQGHRFPTVSICEPCRIPIPQFICLRANVEGLVYNGGVAARRGNAYVMTQLGIRDLQGGKSIGFVNYAQRLPHTRK
jgi:hypothetical protein